MTQHDVELVTEHDVELVTQHDVELQGHSMT